MKRFGMARRVLAIALALTLACAGIAALAKMVTCPACGGSGGTFCSSCGGTGQTRCYSCGGAGFKMTMVMTLDPITHMMVPKQQMQTCTVCGGRGSQMCTSCMGRGRQTCYRCGGSGRIDDGQTQTQQPTTTPTQTPGPYGGVDDPGVPYETKRGTVLAGTKSNRENENVSYMFDDDIYTKYCTATTSLYVIWKAPKPIAVFGYVITTANDNSVYAGRNPRSWTLYGSNTQLGRNGSGGWEKIHEVRNDTVLKDKDYASYIFSVDPAAPAYQYFKLEVTENGGNNCIQMSEFELKGKEGEPEQEQEEEEEATTATVDGLNYKLDNQKKTAALTGPAKSTVTKIVIPSTIKANGKTYKVTEIKAGACKGLAKLKTLSVGKNIQKIGKSAFQKCAKLKTIAIKTKSLTSGSVGSNAFKGIDSKVVVTCPKGKVEDYRKLLKKKGIGDKATFK